MAEEDYEELEVTTPTPRRRKTTKKIEPCRSRKLNKITTRRPMPTLKVISPLRTTLRPYIETTDLPTFTKHPLKTFAKWTKFTLSSRYVDPLIRRIATLKPVVLTEPPMEIEFTTR